MTDPTDRPAASATGTTLVNGEPHPLTAPTSVAELVAALLPAFVSATGPANPTGPQDPAQPDAPRGVAVAIDDVVLPRSAWATTLLRDGDRVEVVTAVQGG